MRFNQPLAALTSCGRLFASRGGDCTIASCAVKHPPTVDGGYGEGPWAMLGETPAKRDGAPTQLVTSFFSRTRKPRGKTVCRRQSVCAAGRACCAQVALTVQLPVCSQRPRRFSAR